MCKSGVFLTLFLIVSTTVLSIASAQSCKACNCQFNNVQALSQLIEVQVNRALANEPRKSHNIFPNNIFKLSMHDYCWANTFYIQYNNFYDYQPKLHTL